MDKAIEIQDESLKKTINVLRMQFEEPSRTIVELCEEVDLNRRTYYRRLDEAHEVLDALRNFMIKSQKSQMAMIASSQEKILEEMIISVLRDKTDNDERVKVMKYLDDRLDLLQDNLGTKPGQEEKAAAFLREGPKTKKQESRFMSVRVSEDQEGGARIDFMKEEDEVIDVTPEEENDRKED